MIYDNCSAQWYVCVRDQVAAHSQQVRDNITLSPYLELKSSGSKCYLGSSGGFVIGPDGTLSGLFSTSRGQGNYLIPEAIKAGAKRLTCYDGPLVEIYRKHGFVVVERQGNYTEGEPQVVYMALAAYEQLLWEVKQEDKAYKGKQAQIDHDNEATEDSLYE